MIDQLCLGRCLWKSRENIKLGGFLGADDGDYVLMLVVMIIICSDGDYGDDDDGGGGGDIYILWWSVCNEKWALS